MKFTLATIAAVVATLAPLAQSTPAPVPNDSAKDMRDLDLAKLLDLAKRSDLGLEKRDAKNFATISHCGNGAWSCNGRGCVDVFTDDIRKTFLCPDKVWGTGPAEDGWYDWWPQRGNVNDYGYLYKNGVLQNPVALCLGGDYTEGDYISCLEIEPSPTTGGFQYVQA